MTRLPHSLEEWRALDARLKTRLQRALTIPALAGELTPRQREAREAGIVAQLALALALPFLLTPVVMILLFPWLPFPDAPLYAFEGATGLLVAALARYRARSLPDPDGA